MSVQGISRKFLRFLDWVLKCTGAEIINIYWLIMLTSEIASVTINNFEVFSTNALVDYLTYTSELLVTIQLTAGDGSCHSLLD
jgi:hypothetical protein